ncbi:MAG TPA: GNAT family N-acetyltransferase [Actinomycetota bacterium]|nr:GNAT family N-acetyltransferase [Actinomycetota bacterium]
MPTLPPDVNVRPAQSDDVMADDLPPPRPDCDEPVWRRTVVAERGGRVVGSGFAVLTRVNDAYWCDVEVSPAHRRHGIGTALFHAVCALTEPSFPLLTRAMRSQPLRTLFAEAIGCELVVHCPEPWADPTAPAWRRWVDDHPVPAGYSAVPMRDLPPAAVEAAWRTLYIWAHAPFAPVQTDGLDAWWNEYRAGLDEDASMLITESESGDAIVALSLVSPEVWDGRTFIVSETVRPDQPGGNDLLCGAVAASLRVLGSRGIARVELEGHTSDPHSPALLASLPEHDADPMDILRLRRL